VLGFAVLICIRLPGPLIHERLWAEEGATFYENAANMPWLRALLTSWGGYLNLVANTAPILARHLVRLEYVPWITTSVGLIFQCFPALILAFSRDPWLDPPLIRIAALLLIATAPLTEEVYLQTLHSQFHLALSCALILALEIPRRRWDVFYGAILFLAPLCGPAACLLVPLFCARAVFDRSKSRAVQALIVGLGAALQFFLFYQHQSIRSGGVGPILLLCIVYLKHIVAPLLGRDIGQQVSVNLRAQIAAGLFPWQPVIMTITSFLLMAVAVWRRGQAAAIWMFLYACLLTPIAYYGALVGGRLLLLQGNGTRYTFVPEALSALALLGIASGHLRPERWAARAMVVWLLVIGFIDVGTPSPFINTGPNWLHEVALWRADPAHRIALWPSPWSMTIAHE
jgi:hypothetical protein